MGVCTLAALGAAAAGDEKPATETKIVTPPEGVSQPTPETGAPTPTKSPLSGFYEPPAPDKRLAGGTVSGSTRSGHTSLCGATVVVLAPTDHIGFTLEAQPTLYFYLSEGADCSVELMVNDRRKVSPLLESPVKTPPKAGLHAARLADFGISLEPNVNYDWFVQVRSASGPPAPDAYAGGQIRRIAAPDGLAADLAKRGARRSATLGQRSLWYDAVAALSAEIDAAPDDALLREQRASLLDYEGLTDAAAREREAATTTKGP